MGNSYRRYYTDICGKWQEWAEVGLPVEAFVAMAGAVGLVAMAAAQGGAAGEYGIAGAGGPDAYLLDHGLVEHQAGAVDQQDHTAVDAVVVENFDLGAAVESHGDQLALGGAVAEQAGDANPFALAALGEGAALRFELEALRADAHDVEGMLQGSE